MPTSHADRSRMPLVQLALPLLIENVLRTSLMSVDTVMLSHFSARAVAAMSLVNTYGFFLQLLYLMVSAGASILITQNLGAGRTREAGLVGVASLALMLAFSLCVSALVAAGAGPLLDLYRLEPEVARYAHQFLALYGGFSFFLAVNVAQASILRSWGHARDPMLVNVLCLVFTVAGNALCLFGWFGFPVLGVVGVAISTVLSQVLGCALCAWMIHRRRDVELPLRALREVPRRVYRAILAIGVPTAGENLAYNISQLAVLAMLTRLGTKSLATYGILLAMLRYVFMPGVSIGSAAQIKVGYLVGAGRYDEAARSVLRWFALAFSISAGLVTLLWFCRAPVLRLFSDDPEVLALAASVLIIALVHEPARNFNTVIIPALKGAGDVRFPVLAGVVSMWTLGGLGAWLLGVRLGYGLPGVWVAMAADEWVRGLVMLLRWRSGAWRSRALLDAGGETALGAAAVELGEGL